MKILPYENVTYKTPMAMRDVLRILTENVDGAGFKPFKRDRTKPHSGEIQAKMAGE